MSKFKTYRDYASFRTHVKFVSRHVFDSEAKDFLDTVLKTSKERKTIIEAGTILWRAQEGNDWREIDNNNNKIDVPCAHHPLRMTPLKNKASEGRVNPKGIPVLYLASLKNTALSEVRPSVGEFVSVAQFKIEKQLNIINCSLGHDSGINLFLREPSPAECEKAVWNDIDRAFSEPVTNGEFSADYAPTQIIAELFKSKGFDGIIYKSYLGNGYNLALFDVSSAEIINCSLYEVEALEYKFKETGDRYFINKTVK